MDFDAELAKFLGTSTMKQSIQKFAIGEMKAGGAGTAGSRQQAEVMVNKAKEAIVASLPLSLKNSRYHKITERDLIVDYVGMSNDGKFQFELSWNPDAVWRDSLYSPGGLNGVDDIVALLENGASPLHHSVWGKWHSRRVYLPQGWRRTPGHFLETCIQWFNIKYQADDVVLRLSPTARYYH